MSQDKAKPEPKPEAIMHITCACAESPIVMNFAGHEH